MTNGAAEPRKAESYTGMLGGGIATVAAGGLGLVVIVVAGTLTNRTVASGWTGLAAVGVIVGAMLVLAGIILRHVEAFRADLDDHKADHQAYAADMADLATIRSHMADVLAFMARWDVERAEERKAVAQIETFLDWLATARRRAHDAAAERADMTPVQRDAAWMSDMAEAMEIGREIERRRPPE